VKVGRGIVMILTHGELVHLPNRSTRRSPLDPSTVDKDLDLTTHYVETILKTRFKSCISLKSHNTTSAVRPSARIEFMLARFGPAPWRILYETDDCTRYGESNCSRANTGMTH